MTKTNAVLATIFTVLLAIVSMSDIPNIYYQKYISSINNTYSEKPEAKLEEQPTEHALKFPDSTITTPQIPEEISKSSIYYTSYYQYYLNKDPEVSTKLIGSDEKNVIPDLDVWDVSNDNKYIANLIRNYETTSALTILNLENNEVTRLVENLRFGRDVKWAPNNCCIVVNFGTSTTGSSVVFDAKTGTKLFGFGTYGTAPKWVSENELLTNDVDEINSEYSRPWEGGGAVSIISYTFPEGTRKVLFQSTPSIDYFLMEVKGRTIIINKTFVENPLDWADSTLPYMEEYWELDLDTKVGSMLTKYERSNFFPELESFVKKTGVDLDEVYISKVTNPKFPAWAIVNISTKNYATGDQAAFLVNLSSQEQFIKIADGIVSAWR